MSLYIDMAFCFVLLPLMVYAFPVERKWGACPLFSGTFTAWLFTDSAYKYFAIPGLFQGRRQRVYAFAVIVASLTVSFIVPKKACRAFHSYWGAGKYGQEPADRKEICRRGDGAFRKGGAA